VILNNIPFEPDLDQLLKRLRIKAGSRRVDDLKRMVSDAQTIAKPKALYEVSFIESRGDDYVVVDGVTFKSRVLVVNLAPVHRVFPYVATCGVELERWASSIDDLLQNYWADTISEMALRSATEALHEHLDERYRPGKTSVMNPGSLPDWPLREQRPLFALLGDPERDIGVQLLDSLLMTPTKSVSGIRFPTEESFASCQLCPRENCPSRRAPYDATLYDEKYRGGESGSRYLL
jgi:hypothetical protein